MLVLYSIFTVFKSARLFPCRCLLYVTRDFNYNLQVVSCPKTYPALLDGTALCSHGCTHRAPGVMKTFFGLNLISPYSFSYLSGPRRAGSSLSREAQTSTTLLEGYQDVPKPEKRCTHGRACSKRLLREMSGKHPSQLTPVSAEEQQFYAELLQDVHVGCLYLVPHSLHFAQN